MNEPDTDTLLEHCPVCEGEGTVVHTCATSPLVHRVIKGYLDEGELVIGWVLTMDVAGPDDTRYLAHRAGGGHDGSDPPTLWNALGMIEVTAGMVREELDNRPTDVVEDDDEEGE